MAKKVTINTEEKERIITDIADRFDKAWGKQDKIMKSFRSKGTLTQEQWKEFDDCEAAVDQANADFKKFVEEYGE